MFGEKYLSEKTLPETNIANLKKKWIYLEDELSFLFRALNGLFSGAKTLLVSGRVQIPEYYDGYPKWRYSWNPEIHFVQGPSFLVPSLKLT